MKVNSEKCVSDCLLHQEGWCCGWPYNDSEIDCQDFKKIPNDYNGHEEEEKE